jgi:ATP/maltotriose-dependent transcriptional regulator MalT/DNA-binding SARP family transcriptional activator
MDSNTLTLAKVTRPNLPKVIRRKRLYDLLSPQRQQSAVWVSGPPGSGKTTLVANFVECFKIPCLWYNLDDGDTDPANFFHYLGLAAEKAATGTHPTMPHLTPEYLPGISTFSRLFFENLYLRLSLPAVIVFDNYQEVSEEAALHELIRTGLSVIPAEINIVFISRSGPPSQLMRQKANRRMRVIGWDQLKFTLEESRQLLDLIANRKLSKDIIAELYGYTDGWAAGLVLLMEAVRERIFDPGKIGHMAQHDVFAYFAEEIFDRIDESTRRFLLETSLLPEMTTKMAEAQTDRSDANHMLSRLHQHHYFTDKRTHFSEPVYRYHPLFRDFLLKKAAIALSSKMLSDLRNRAADLLEDAGQVEAAVELHRENNSWQKISRLIAKKGPTLLKQGRNLLLKKWLSGLPSEILESDPWLGYWMGVCCFPLNAEKSQTHLERAFELFKRRKDGCGMFLAWSAVVDAIAFEFEDLTKLDRWIQELENQLDEFSQLPSAEISARVTVSMFFALFLRKPEHYDLEKWAERARLVCRHKEIDENIKAQSLFNLVHHRAMNGEMNEAESLLHELDQLAGTSSASPLTQLRAKFAATAFYQGVGFYDKCLTAMKDGLSLSKKSGIHVWDVWLLTYGAAGAMNANDIKTAENLLDKLSTYQDRMKSWELSGYHFLTARLALICNKLKKADFHVNVSLELAERIGVFSKFSWPLLLKAQILQSLQKHAEARTDLERVCDIAQQTNSDLFRFHALMMEAQFACERGDTEEGLRSLHKALTLGKDQKYLNTFADKPTMTAKLCTNALEAGIEENYVQEIIRRRRLIPEEPPVDLENWPWMIKIFTLGRFGIVVDGKPLRFTRKAQEKPLALLKVLIAFGGRDVHEEPIADALWPESDGDLAHKSFATTLWRLRKLIGCPDAIQLRDKKLTVDPRYCWVDVWSFERLLRQAESAWEKGTTENDMTDALCLAQKALDIYQGPFLSAEASAPWAISLRERVHSRFLRTVKQLCEYWKQTGHYEDAVACFQRSLEVDDLAEDFYHDLMSCYLQLNRRTDALALYERYKETVSSKLGVEPSAELDRLRIAIMSDLNSDK